ncbi:hypothetical protein SAMN04488528_10011, partial [Clostridium frigidicarnis]
LSTEQIMKKWTSPIQHWASTLAQLSILFEGRFEV